MEKIVIFGAGKAGKFLFDQINSETREYEVVAFLDNLIGGAYHGIPILRPQEFFEEVKIEYDAVFITAGAQKTLKLMIKTCRLYGVDNIYMLHDIAGKCRLPLFQSGEIVPRYIRKLRFSDERPSLAYFEVPITDNCNLNCRGCLFASSLSLGVQHVPLNQIQQDAKKMSELFCDVPWIRILGGEPLLHPNIKEVIECYRKYFPDSEIDLCTNGLLITKMDEMFWECINNNNISIHVSGYKPTYQMLEKIDRILKKQNIPYAILKRDEFVKYYTINGDNDINKSYNKCIASGCYEVYRGRISTCSAMIAFERFNDFFGTSYNVIEGEDWFNIHNSDIDAWEVSCKLDQPSQMCRYCSESKEEHFEWNSSKDNVNIEDFVIDR